MFTLTYEPHGRSLINGVAVEPAGKTFESRSRIDGSRLGTFTSASDGQIHTALNLAAAAFFETAVLSPRTVDDHAHLLLEILHAFEARMPDIKAAGSRAGLSRCESRCRNNSRHVSISPSC